MSAHHMPTQPFMHKPFSWFSDAAAPVRDGDFITLTRDICRGAELCMQISITDELDREAQSPTLFSPSDLERLTMLSIAALRLLGDRAEMRIEDINDAAARGAV